jgi:DNA-directed RNA polymerase specialized sigma24 family protein
MHHNITDRELVEMVIAGNSSSYEWLVERYQDSVIAVLVKRFSRDVAEKLIKKIFIDAFGKLEDIGEKETFSDWLLIIVLQHCHKYRLKENSGKKEDLNISKNERESIKSVINARFSSDFSFSGGIIDLREKVFRQLSPEEQLLIEGIYFEGFSTYTMARVLYCSRLIVNLKAWMARYKMRRIMAELVDFDDVKEESNIKGILEYEQ